jgi:uncharacterized OsmC-like protein
VGTGGFDEGMTAPELLLASLGSCAGFYAAQYLRKHKLATEGTRVRVTCEKVKDPVARMSTRPLSSARISARDSIKLSQTASCTILSRTRPKSPSRSRACG